MRQQASKGVATRGLIYSPQGHSRTVARRKLLTGKGKRRKPIQRENGPEAKTWRENAPVEGA